MGAGWGAIHLCGVILKIHQCVRAFTFNRSYYLALRASSSEEKRGQHRQQYSSPPRSEQPSAPSKAYNGFALGKKENQRRNWYSPAQRLFEASTYFLAPKKHCVQIKSIATMYCTVALIQPFAYNLQMLCETCNISNARITSRHH